MKNPVINIHRLLIMHFCLVYKYNVKKLNQDTHIASDFVVFHVASDLDCRAIAERKTPCKGNFSSLSMVF